MAESIRTHYEKEVIRLITSIQDNALLGEAIRTWYSKNKESLEYETPESFRECNRSDADRYDDYKHGLTFGMK